LMTLKHYALYAIRTCTQKKETRKRRN